ncbi:MAG: DUF2391 family protein [archaeon]
MLKKHREVIIVDQTGKALVKLLSPLRTEFHLKDVLQVIIGASILAIPVGFTEESWKLAETLPLANVLGFVALSILFISIFVYYNYHKEKIKETWEGYFKRTALTYVLSFIVVAIILTLIQKTPWATDSLLALKRVALVTFPASMSAAVADTIH